MKKTYSQEGKYTFLAVSFIFLLVGIVLLSFLYKIVTIVQASTFDGKHQYILAVKQNQQHAMVLGFNPEANTIAVLSVSMPVVNALQVGVAYDNQMAGIISQSAVASFFQQHIFMQDGLNVLDKLKLYLVSRSATVTSFSVKGKEISADDAKKIAELFQDKNLYQEAKSVAIVNESGVSGLGTMASQMLSTIGANVISVNGNSLTTDSTTIQYAGDKSYTLSRLEQIFHVTAVKLTAAPSVADITIILGKNITQKLE